MPPIFACLCFALAACSGASTGDGSSEDTTPTAGSFGTSGSTSSGGSTSLGGSSTGTGTSGATSTNGGASPGGTSSFAGSTSASGGTTAAGGEAAGGADASGGTSWVAGSGGSSEVGGSAGTTGSAGSGGQGGGSTGLAIDYSIWQLQLPIGSGDSPTTVAPSKLAAFSDTYFYKGDDGGQIFMDPVTGITTSGSQHPRTELRESTTSGGQAAWSASATNTMTVTGKVMKGTSVTIAQVFNGPDSITLGELQYNSGIGGLELFYEESKGNGTEHDLNTPIALNEKYTFTMSLTKNVLSVTVNGKQVYTHTPSASTLSSQFYFKVGNYDQSATKGAISTTVHSLVEDYSIVVVHK